ncbi:SIMPL domain-containing protein [Halobacillus sp. ACCC02827]|uniref:SIMPL domain-containing protein n=1 Tax=Halobacillus sp. ACCC02827 TaxID=3052090 RepID=UPI002570A611|nr:SIMPL domain-containing protein [Halobacillus sp. ACCC02827]WJE17069.1 SIMPL domain-containing protein [Halobacillus sp. ACCC02827]
MRHGEGRIMKVTGSGTVDVIPDRAVLEVGVVTEKESLEQAQKENAAVTERVKRQLMQAGVPEEAIQTSQYTIFPEYDYVDGSQVFRGYQVTHLLQITIDQVEQTGYLIDTAVANGANRVSSITFTIRNPEQAYQQALTKALAGAVAHAGTMAETMAVQLDPTPIRMTEITNGTQPVQPFQKTQMLQGSATPIQPGTIGASAAVEVWFQYLP